MKSKLNKVILVISIVGFLLLSVSFLLMPLNKNSLEPNIFAGILFWCSLFIGVISQIILSFRIKKLNDNNARHGLGLLKFFQNPYAKICDVVLVISVIGLIITMIVTDGLGYACYIFLAMTVFFFAMHCILNGKNYYNIHKKTILDGSNKEMLERKKEREENED